MHESTASQRKSRPAIFLVEDDDARPGLTANLRKEGYRLLVAACLVDAHEWVSGVGSGDMKLTVKRSDRPSSFSTLARNAVCTR